MKTLARCGGGGGGGGGGRWVGIGLVTAFLTWGVCAQEFPPKPGPEHESMKRLVGEWTAIVKSPAGESKGTMSYRLECGGLWLVSDFKGEMMGQAFQGRGLDSYDPHKKKYVSVWVDSMSTRPMLFEGEIDPATKVVTMVGEGPGPDGKPARWKSVSRSLGPDREEFKMFVAGADGKDEEVMTIEYTRKK